MKCFCLKLIILFLSSFILASACGQEIGIPYRDGVLWGIADIEGNIIVEPEYEKVDFPRKEGNYNTLFEQCFEVTRDGKVGVLCDKEEVIRCKLSNPTLFPNIVVDKGDNNTVTIYNLFGEPLFAYDSISIELGTPSNSSSEPFYVITYANNDKGLFYLQEGRKLVWYTQRIQRLKVTPDLYKGEFIGWKICTKKFLGKYKYADYFEAYTFDRYLHTCRVIRYKKKQSVYSWKRNYKNSWYSSGPKTFIRSINHIGNSQSYIYIPRDDTVNLKDYSTRKYEMTGATNTPKSDFIFGFKLTDPSKILTDTLKTYDSTISVDSIPKIEPLAKNDFKIVLSSHEFSKCLDPNIRNIYLVSDTINGIKKIGILNRNMNYSVPVEYDSLLDYLIGAEHKWYILSKDSTHYLVYNNEIIYTEGFTKILTKEGIFIAHNDGKACVFDIVDGEINLLINWTKSSFLLSRAKYLKGRKYYKVLDLHSSEYVGYISEDGKEYFKD